MHKKARMKNALSLLIALCLTTSVAFGDDNKSPDREMQKAYVGIVNRTDKQLGAMSLDPYGTDACCTAMAWHQRMPVIVSDGIPMACCTVLPDRWSDDMRVRIRWRIKGDSPQKYRESIVSIEKYTGRGTLYVHFFMDGKIRLVVSRFSPTDEKHPISPDDEMDANS